MILIEKVLNIITANSTCICKLCIALYCKPIMCGIAGVISLLNNKAVTKDRLEKMAAALSHRGPDGEGYFINEENTVGFAHKRLSIIDLTANAAQPLSYLHYTITYNGEIYNYLELKKTLSQKGYTFSTQSDTEVILAAYDFWGKDCLHQFEGMFAFVIYNRQQKNIFAARDVFGEKPFYYSIAQENKCSVFYFASEIKALVAAGINKEVNNTNLLNYLTLGFTSNPSDATETFYGNIKSLPAGCCIQIANDNLQIKNWKQTDTFVNKLQNQSEIIDQFTALLKKAVSKSLTSDVAVGTSLSGGIDSSAIISTIHQLSEKGNYKPQAFTASFPMFDKDETEYSKTVAQHFGIKQFFTTPSANDFANEFSLLMYHQEEPIQSSSIFTQYMVYKLAKENGIKVLLDGQGADEILGGYTKYTNWFLQEILRTNLSLFRKEKALLKTNEFLQSWSYKSYVSAFLPTLTAKKLQKKATKQQLVNDFIDKDFLHQNIKPISKPVIKNLQDILNYNTNIFGLNDLLRFADKNSMANSCEVRLPFLNKDLVSFTASLPATYKIQNGFTKWILRESIKNQLPEEIVWRKGKIGYEPPQQLWMQNAAIKSLINEARLKLVNRKILNPKILNTTVQAKSAHQENNFDFWVLCAAELIN